MPLNSPLGNAVVAIEIPSLGGIRLLPRGRWFLIENFSKPLRPFQPRPSAAPNAFALPKVVGLFDFQSLVQSIKLLGLFVNASFGLLGR